MEINANWSKRIKLLSGSKHNLIFAIDLEQIPTLPGCYIFYNLHGKSYSVLYVGRADNLRKRLEQQLNNLKLMMGIKNSLSGQKNVIFCTLKKKQGNRSIEY